jgi:hypothetical protein
MKNLFEAAMVEELKQRLTQLQPDSERLWGTMNAAQALAHCSAGLELAVGERIPQRLMLGRIIGRMVKPLALGNDEPIKCLGDPRKSFVGHPDATQFGTSSRR